MLSEFEEWEATFKTLDLAIHHLRWVQFWTNTLTAWLYGGYRERWRGRGFPMDN